MRLCMWFDYVMSQSSCVDCDTCDRCCPISEAVSGTHREPELTCKFPPSSKLTIKKKKSKPPLKFSLNFIHVPSVHTYCVPHYNIFINNSTIPVPYRYQRYNIDDGEEKRRKKKKCAEEEEDDIFFFKFNNLIK